MKKHCFIFPLLFFNLFVYSQTVKSSFQIAVGGLYNFQTEGKATDIRLMCPLTGGLYFTPRLSYFPSSNLVHETYYGFDFDYYSNLYKRINTFIYLGGYYDYWKNSNEFNNNLAKTNNIVYEGGGGLMLNFGCINPYIEYRYDAKWGEASLGAGILVRFCNCFASKMPNSQRCPKF